jgi:drug/metabolite transporter (DMT)-like permease
MLQDRWLGITLAASSAAIWGMQSVITRQAIADGLTAADVTLLRFVVAGLLVLPIAVRLKPPVVGALGWRKAVILATLAGAPFSLVIVGGLLFAPAIHHAVISPGLVPIIASGLAVAISGERLGRLKIGGIALIGLGVLVFSQEALSNVSGREGAWRGDLFFVAAASMWAVFGFLSQRWRADPKATMVSSCILSVLSLPIWLSTLPSNLLAAAPSTLILQAGYQGVLVGAVGILFYSRAVAVLGSVGAALFIPLVPAIAAVGAWLLLGERPTTAEMFGTSIVVLGMLLALGSSGGKVSQN